MQSDSNILQIDNLSRYFGGLAAVNDCSLKIKKGSITGIIGPNGSGKTTLFNLIAGNLKPSEGKVLFYNEDITSVPSYELFSKGILRTFQIAHEFTNLTVLENLMMVPGNQSGEKLINALLKPGIVKKEDNTEFAKLILPEEPLGNELGSGASPLLEDDELGGRGIGFISRKSGSEREIDFDTASSGEFDNYAQEDMIAKSDEEEEAGSKREPKYILVPMGEFEQRFSIN